MTKEYGFFASKERDRRYSADDFSAFFSDFFTDGVLAKNTRDLMVTASGGMQLSVSGGTAYIKGRWFRKAESTSLRLTESDINYCRWDAVVLRCDFIGRKIGLEIIEGIPEENPSKPLPERSEICHDLVLAYIYVRDNAADITQADIHDTRGEAGLCGYVTGIIKQIDTTGLFAQYEAAFRDVLGNLEDGSGHITVDLSDNEAREKILFIYGKEHIADMFRFI